MAIGLTVGAFIVFLMKLEPGKGSDFMVRLPVEGPADSSRAGKDDDARKTVLDRLFTRAERQA